jgi:hypothetical protein
VKELLQAGNRAGRRCVRRRRVGCDAAARAGAEERLGRWGRERMGNRKGGEGSF